MRSVKENRFNAPLYTQLNSDGFICIAASIQCYKDIRSENYLNTNRKIQNSDAISLRIYLSEHVNKTNKSPFDSPVTFWHLVRRCNAH